MIGKIRFENGRNYLCDDCGQKQEKFKNYEAARAAGWAVSWERTYCYCPACAPYHRLGGANKNDTTTTQSNGSQLKIGS